MLTLQQARCCEHGRAGGRRPPSRKLWHIAVSKRRCWLPEKTTNVYDKKPQRYAKDNRIAHLTARSDKSVAYVTLRFVLLNVTTDTKHRAASLRQQSYLYCKAGGQWMQSGMQWGTWQEQKQMAKGYQVSIQYRQRPLWIWIRLQDQDQSQTGTEASIQHYGSVQGPRKNTASFVCRNLKIPFLEI